MKAWMRKVKNSEGYNDPTAGEALARIIREEKKKRKAVQRLNKKSKTTGGRSDERVEDCLRQFQDGEVLE